jgi:molybdenum cofactor cytidylyltransferase
MRRPKALLEVDGETFLGRWIAVLEGAGVQEIRIVLGRDHREIRSRLALPDDRVVVNRRPEAGMISSFLLGIGQIAPPVDGVFLCPVDHPDVGSRVVQDLAAAFLPGHIIVPVAKGRRGHPVLFAAELIDELRQAPPSEGARAVVRRDPRRVIEIEAGPGVLCDVDTPDEYRRFRGR